VLNKYLEKNYNKLKDMSHNIAGDNGKDDLLSFIIEQLYDCDKDKIKEIIKKNQMTFYIARVMVNQYYSKTSRYYYLYKRYYKHHPQQLNEGITQDHYDSEEYKIKEERLEWIDHKLKKCRWFDVELFKLYYKGNHSLNSLSKATKINRNTIYHSINEVKKYLKNEKK
tara:strand:+ start:13777 stop:14280 length:504 start_codon:yes stop_codon:yes gene_type:complete